jgi:hypothetical protein
LQLVVVIAILLEQNFCQLKIKMSKFMANLTTPSKKNLCCSSEEYSALFTPKKISGIDPEKIKKACSAAEQQTKAEHLKLLRRDFMLVMRRV